MHHSSPGSFVFTGQIDIPKRKVCTKSQNRPLQTCKYIEQMKEEIKANPIMFGNFELKFKESYVYLGDVISAGGLEANILETIAHRA